MGRSSEAVSYPLLFIFCKYPCYLTVLGPLCTRYGPIHKLIYNDELDVKTSHLCPAASICFEIWGVVDTGQKILIF